jgi:hypothetical protein
MAADVDLITQVALVKTATAALAIGIAGVTR